MRGKGEGVDRRCYLVEDQLSFSIARFHNCIFVAVFLYKTHFLVFLTCIFLTCLCKKV